MDTPQVAAKRVAQGAGVDEAHQLIARMRSEAENIAYEYELGDDYVLAEMARAFVKEFDSIRPKRGA